MIIALDGPAGVGKSTIAKLISQRNHLFYLNSGNFYRSVTFCLLQSGGDPQNEAEVVQVARRFQPAFEKGRFLVDGVEMEEAKLHSDSVDRWVASHSAIAEVRHWVNEKIRALCAGMDLVCEGRDMTTVVFPEAEFKFFLDASPAVRAGRRYRQGVSRLSLAEIEQSIAERDLIDRNKPTGRLTLSDSAHYIDTSDLSAEQVCQAIESVVFHSDREATETHHMEKI